MQTLRETVRSSSQGLHDCNLEAEMDSRSYAVSCGHDPLPFWLQNDSSKFVPFARAFWPSLRGLLRLSGQHIDLAARRMRPTCRRRLDGIE